MIFAISDPHTSTSIMRRRALAIDASTPTMSNSKSFPSALTMSIRKFCTYRVATLSDGGRILSVC